MNNNKNITPIDQWNAVQHFRRVVDELEDNRDLFQAVLSRGQEGPCFYDLATGIARLHYELSQWAYGLRDPHVLPRKR